MYKKIFMSLVIVLMLMPFFSSSVVYSFEEWNPASQKYKKLLEKYKEFYLKLEKSYQKAVKDKAASPDFLKYLKNLLEEYELKKNYGTGKFKNQQQNLNKNFIGNSDKLIFSDHFDDSFFKDKWYIKAQDDEIILEKNSYLLHKSPKTYNDGGNFLTHKDFLAKGVITLTFKHKMNNPDYWGSGFGIRCGDSIIIIKEQKWGKKYVYFNLVINGKDFEGRHIKVAPDPTSSEKWITYKLKINFDEDKVVSVSRNNQFKKVNADISEINSNKFKILLGNGRGHSTKYDYVKMKRN